MEYVFFVDVLNCSNDASNNEFGLIFWKSDLLTDSVSQIGSTKQIHDKIKVFPIIESANHICKKRITDTF